MLLIIKERLWEPTIFMMASDLANNGPHSKASWLTHPRRLAKAAVGESENSKSYEQTQHLIENKQSCFGKPNMLLKTNMLLVATQHVIDNRYVIRQEGKIDRVGEAVAVVYDRGTWKTVASVVIDRRCRSRIGFFQAIASCAGAGAKGGLRRSSFQSAAGRTLPPKIF